MPANEINAHKKSQILDEQALLDKQVSYNQGKNCNTSYRMASEVIQKVLPDPFLINDEEIDYRSYILIASMDPFIVLFHPGVIRMLSADFGEGDLDAEDRENQMAQFNY